MVPVSSCGSRAKPRSVNDASDDAFTPTAEIVYSASPARRSGARGPGNPTGVAPAAAGWDTRPASEMPLARPTRSPSTPKGLSGYPSSELTAPHQKNAWCSLSASDHPFPSVNASRRGGGAGRRRRTATPARRRPARRHRRSGRSAQGVSREPAPRAGGPHDPRSTRRRVRHRARPRRPEPRRSDRPRSGGEDDPGHVFHEACGQVWPSCQSTGWPFVPAKPLELTKGNCRHRMRLRRPFAASHALLVGDGTTSAHFSTLSTVSSATMLNRGCSHSPSLPVRRSLVWTAE
jgi:hypothetical protein